MAKIDNPSNQANILINTLGCIDQLITLLQMGENVLAVRVVETTLFNLYS